MIGAPASIGYLQATIDPAGPPMTDSRRQLIISMMWILKNQVCAVLPLNFLILMRYLIAYANFHKTL